MIGEIDEERLFKFGQLNRRSFRLAGLAVAYIAGIIFTYWLLTLLQVYTEALWPEYEMPPFPYIYIVVIIIFAGIGFSLYTEWVIIQIERRAIKK